VDKTFKEAPQFMWLYTVLVVGGAMVILIPGMPLIPIMVFSQVANGILLPVILIFIIKLVNNKQLMGDYVNSPWFNAIAWTCTVLMIILSLIMTFDLIFPRLLF
jgi:Mn2+/Fe2+ NRAMP family transporter